MGDSPPAGREETPIRQGRSLQVGSPGRGGFFQVTAGTLERANGMSYRPVFWLIGALLLLGGVPPAPAQTIPEESGELADRLEMLEAKSLELANRLNLLTERLDALVGPGPGDRLYTLPVEGSAIRGDPEAPITLVEFGDYQSYYSARAHHVVARLLEEYPQSLRFVYKHLPLAKLHPEAADAALAALAADKQAKPWEMHDLLFQNSRRLEPVLYLLLAQRLELELPQFETDRRSLWAQERLAQDEKLAARVGVGAVPAFFLNGRLMANWRYDFLKAQVDKLLAEGSEKK